MTVKKKILIVGQHYWPETFRITDIAEGLVERGYEVDVLCGIPNYPAGKFFKGYGFLQKRRQHKSGVRIIRVPEIPRGNNSSFRIGLNFISYPFFALFYIPWLLTQKYDRIIAYQLSPVFMSLPAIILSKLKAVPLYIYVCDFWPHSLFSMLNITNRFAKKLITSISYWHYRQADGAIAVFKGMRQRLISDVGLTIETTLYIPQAPERLYESRPHDKVLSKRFEDYFVIVFAGNINPAQSFDVIIKAAQIVAKSGIEDIRYVIVGEGMSSKWLKSEVNRLKLTKYFVFEGLNPVERIPYYQVIADAMIVALSKSPLFEYGIPAKVYSYMPSGKPIIGAMDGAGKDLINLSKSGICVESGDYKGLAEAIQSIYYMKPTDRRVMGMNGANYYSQHFDRDVNLDRLIEFVMNNNRIEDKEVVG